MWRSRLGELIGSIWTTSSRRISARHAKHTVILAAPELAKQACNPKIIRAVNQWTQISTDIADQTKLWKGLNESVRYARKLPRLKRSEAIPWQLETPLWFARSSRAGPSE